MGQPAPRKSCQSYAKICFYCQIYLLNKKYYAFYWFGKEISVSDEKTKTEKNPLRWMQCLLRAMDAVVG